MSKTRQAKGCLIEDCNRSGRIKRGMCNLHYGRWLRHGDPLVNKLPHRGEAKRFFYEVVLTYKGEECLIWPFSRDEEGRARFLKDGRMRIASRLVCEEVNGPPPSPDHHAAHECGNAHLGCVAPTHLSWKTRSENEADKLAHGTVARGERNGNAKLTEAAVEQIRAEGTTSTNKEIAKKHGVSESAIQAVLAGKRWGWIGEQHERP